MHLCVVYTEVVSRSGTVILYILNETSLEIQIKSMNKLVQKNGFQQLERTNTFNFLFYFHSRDILLALNFLYDLVF